MPTFQADQLQTLAESLFTRVGALPPHAEAVARHLVESNLFGHDSHGVMRVQQYCAAIEEGELDPRATPVLRAPLPAGGVFDGRHGFGQVAATTAMESAIEHAKNFGVGLVTLHNAYHSGRLAAYTTAAAAAGMIGVVMVNAGGGGQSVAPFGGAQRRLATNPFSIAVPSNGPFHPVLDVATSMAPEGKIRDFFRRGRPVPPGWIVDSQGRPTTDPADFYAFPPGALLPWGGGVGYKGFGLAFMIDILAGALSGAGVCTAASVPATDGLFLLAIDFERYVPRGKFLEQVDDLCEYIKSCQPAAPDGEVFIPGELEYLEAQRRRKSGIQVDDASWREIQILADRYGVDCPRETTFADGTLTPAAAAADGSRLASS